MGAGDIVGMSGESVLKIEEATCPNLVCFASIVIVRTVIIRTEITVLVPRRGEPGIQQRIGDRLTHLMTGRSGGCIRDPIRTVRSSVGAKANRGVAVGLVTVDDG